MIIPLLVYRAVPSGALARLSALTMVAVVIVDAVHRSGWQPARPALDHDRSRHAVLPLILVVM
jgi:hypothetical protein